MPTQMVTGTHKEIGPAYATKMDRVLPNSIVKVFPNSSHVPFYKEPSEYFTFWRIFCNWRQEKYLIIISFLLL